MADLEDIRRIALSLPEAVAGDDGSAYGILVASKVKFFTWPWLERLQPKKARVRNLSVYGVRVENLSEKEMLLASDTVKFFTEDHYNGYPAVLVRIAEVDEDELTELLTDAWRCVAPKRLVKQFDAATDS